MSYYSSKQHIAASGAKAGQWVKCIAQGNCRLGGLHVEERTLKEVQDWAGRRAYADLTQKDYEDYLQSQIRGTLEQDKRPMETLEEKRERIGRADGRATKAPAERKQQAGTKLRETQKLKGTLPEEEYYNRLFEDYPEIDKMSLAEKKRIEKLLNKKHPENAYGSVNFTDKAKTLKTWVKNGNIENLDRLTTYVNATTKKPSPEVRAFASQVINAVENQRKVTVTQVTSVPKNARSIIPQTQGQSQHQREQVAQRREEANRIPDYKPLNDESPATQAVLKQLQNYEIPGQGAFGSKTKEDKIVEYMVRNQLRFTGTAGDYSFEKIPATQYARDLDGEVSHNYKTIPLVKKYNTLRDMKNKLEKTVDQHDNHVRMQKSIHDSFVEASRKELQLVLFQKGHDDGEYALKVASATKASEIYSLKNAIKELKQQDEFSRAGL